MRRPEVPTSQHQAWLEEQGRVRRARADRAVKTRRAKAKLAPSLEVDLLGIVADLLKGGRHCRATVAKKAGRSLSTADRWLQSVERILPGARRVKAGKVAWITTAPPKPPPVAKEVLPLQLPLSEQAMELLAQLSKKGIYGRTTAEVAARFIDRALVEILARGARA